MSQVNEMESRSGAQATRHALKLLSLVVHTPTPLGLSELARLSGVNKPTVYRLLRALEEEAYLARAEGSRKYVPGAGLIALASVVVGGVHVRTVARPVLERIAELTGETVTLHVPSLSQRICVEGVESMRSVRRAVVLGHIAPLYEGATGRAILAHLDPFRMAAVLAEAAGTGIDAKSLEAELPSIRAAGYVARLKERDGSRIGAIAVPIFTASGVCASITVAGPSDRLNLSASHKAAPAIKKECAALSAALGFTPAQAAS